MIRVFKGNNVPSSLTTTSRYDGDDVKKQLQEDQHDKCYLCERNRVTDFVIEHHKSKVNYPDLVQVWENLFMGCSYCNGKKSTFFDNTLRPNNINIEDEIEQRMDLSNKKAVFASRVDDEEHAETVALLSRIYNGSKKVRNFREERFFEQALGIYNRFTELVKAYHENPNQETEKAIRDELSIDKELLGFKYWIIKNNEVLADIFSHDIIWNKTI